MSDFEIKYVGPGPESLTVNFEPVALGETVKVDEAEASRLVANGAWEVVGGPKKKPKPAEPGEEVALAVPPGDVHEQSEASAEVETESPAGGVEEGV